MDNSADTRGEEAVKHAAVLASISAVHERQNSPIRERQPAAKAAGPGSRKNKPQRCSTCGLVGHKARTCRKAAPEGDGTGPPPTKKRIDQQAAAAADGLLKMFGAGSPVDLSEIPTSPPRPVPAVVIARAAPKLVAGPVLAPPVAGSNVLFAYPAVMAQAANANGELKRKHTVVRAIPALQQLDSGGSVEM